MPIISVLEHVFTFSSNTYHNRRHSAFQDGLEERKERKKHLVNGVMNTGRRPGFQILKALSNKALINQKHYIQTHQSFNAKQWEGPQMFHEEMRRADSTALSLLTFLH